MPITAPVTWLGGKAKLAPRIINFFPGHETDVEVFGGSAAVLMAKSPVGVEIYNDIDEGVVNLFRVLRDPTLCDKLRFALDRTPYSRAEFELAKEKASDPVEAARRLVVRHRQSRGGLAERWSYSIQDTHAGVASTIRRWQRGIDHLSAVHNRFKSVQIENDDWRQILPRYDSKETLFFCDPPYHPFTRVAGSYDHELTRKDHRELVAWLLGVRGMVVLSGYENDDYKPLERASWKCVAFDVPANISNRRTRRVECVWLSPSIAARKRTLFLTPRQRMREGARETHRIRVNSTTQRITRAMQKIRANGQKITIIAVARATKMSREHLGRNYRHLFAV